ncbi:MAG TPA: flagellar hook-basal body complex protein FliE [Polyangiaceae bacterium]|nr:flagellar hook-basal body complex protein FliE [Polyangiaceae bacterium]
MSPLEASALSLQGPIGTAGLEDARDVTPAPAGFSELLESAVASANESALAASSAATEFAAGQRDDIHGTMLAVTKADIELHLLGSVRNKVIDAFYEIWRMQI